MKLSLHLGKFSFNLGSGSPDAPTLQRANPPTSSPAQAWLRGDDRYGISNSPLLVSPLQQSVWVYTAISALAQTVSAIPFRISQGDRSGENILSKGPVVDLFNRPHPYLNRFRFWEFIVTWYCLRGEAFIVALDKADNILPIGRSHGPTSLLVLNPDRFRHIVENSELVGWRFTNSPLAGPLRSMDFLPEDVIHDFLPNPYLFWRGMSPLSVALLAAQTDYASAQFMKGLMMNNADTGVVVRTNQQMGPEQRETLLAALRDRKNSAGTADRPLVLWDGAEVVTPTLSSADMQFLEHRKYNRQEICAAFFRMPQSIIGFTESSNRSIAEAERLNFIENSIAPVCARLEAAVDPIIKSFGADLLGWFDIDSHPILQQARRDRVDTGVKLFSLGYPANAINKALDLGLPHLPWGEKGYLPAKMTEVGEGAPKSPGVAAAAGVFERLLGRLEAADGPDGSDGSAVTVRACASVKQKRSKLSAFFFEQRKRVLAKLSRINAEGAESFAEGSEKKTSPTSAVKSLSDIFNAPEQDQRLIAKLAPLLRADLELGFAQAIAEPLSQINAEGAKSFAEGAEKMPSEQLASFLAQRAQELPRINQTTFEALQASLQQGLENHEALPALAARVKRIFQDATDHRAEAIAAAETELALNTGRYLATFKHPPTA